jgi:hypothetical protein
MLGWSRNGTFSQMHGKSTPDGAEVTLTSEKLLMSSYTWCE